MDTGSLYGGVDSPLVQAEYSDQKQQWVAKVKIGGYTGWIAQENFEIVPLSWIKSTSSYTVTNDDIRHNYVAKIQNYYCYPIIDYRNQIRPATTDNHM